MESKENLTPSGLIPPTMRAKIYGNFGGKSIFFFGQKSKFLLKDRNFIQKSKTKMVRNLKMVYLPIFRKNRFFMT